MELYRAGSATTRPPESTFTGVVDIGGFFRSAAPSRLVGASVTFQPGARTPWKVNPLGQVVVVTRGVGWVQVEGEEVVEVGAGDFVWFAPGQWHWEGATLDDSLTYVAVQEEDSRSVVFGDAVTDDEHGRGPSR